MIIVIRSNGDEAVAGMGETKMDKTIA